MLMIPQDFILYAVCTLVQFAFYLLYMTCLSDVNSGLLCRFGFSKWKKKFQGDGSNQKNFPWFPCHHQIDLYVCPLLNKCSKLVRSYLIACFQQWFNMVLMYLLYFRLLLENKKISLVRLPPTVRFGQT